MSKKQPKKTSKSKEDIKSKDEKVWAKVPFERNKLEGEEMDGLGVTFEQAMTILSRAEKEN